MDELKELTIHASNGVYTFEVVDQDARDAASSAREAVEAIEIPTKVSDLENDLDLSDYAKMTDMFARTTGYNLAEFITIPGTINHDGSDNSNASQANLYTRSDYIAVYKGETIEFNYLYGLTNRASFVAVDKEKGYLYHVAGKGSGVVVKDTYTMPCDGYVRFATSNTYLAEAYIRLKITPPKKKLNILVFGNSFSQDSFAYLPPVLNEILTDYEIKYGVAYKSSASLSDHVAWYNDETLYTWFNLWDVNANKWKRIANGINGKKLTDIMAMEQWDIIYIQPTGSSQSDAVIESEIITPGRQLLRILQSLSGGPFTLMVGQWLATSDGTFVNLCDGMQKTKQRLGIYDYIPIGTAMENARTNETLKALGDDNDGTGYGMLYDNHMQSGLPALIATYTIALKILDFVGESRRGIYGSTFEPTTDNCITIGAYYDTGMDGDHKPMTHGASVGVTAENIRAAQEIAVLAVNNPTVITDCSDIIV